MDRNLDRIKAIALDIDGVMTDGRVIPLADGDLLRILDAKDALAVRVAGMKGYILAIMSGGDTAALRRRMEDMNIRPENIFLGCRGKLAVFERFCAQNGLSPEEVMYIGDDLPDVPVLRAAGLGIAPADAAQDAKEAADRISPCAGGQRCVRTEIERLMRYQGKWEFDYAQTY